MALISVRRGITASADQDSLKNMHPINAVDCVTQIKAVAICKRIRESLTDSRSIDVARGLHLKKPLNLLRSTQYSSKAELHLSVTISPPL